MASLAALQRRDGARDPHKRGYDAAGFPCVGALSGVVAPSPRHRGHRVAVADVALFALPGRLAPAHVSERKMAVRLVPVSAAVQVALLTGRIENGRHRGHRRDSPGAADKAARSSLSNPPILQTKGRRDTSRPGGPDGHQQDQPVRRRPSSGRSPRRSMTAEVGAARPRGRVMSELHCAGGHIDSTVPSLTPTIRVRPSGTEVIPRASVLAW